MSRVRHKRYTAAFKAEAIRLVQTSDRPVTEIAEHLGVTAKSLHEWIRQHRPPAPERLSGDERTELAQLRRENARLRMERDILKNESRALVPDLWARNSLTYARTPEAVAVCFLVTSRAR